MVDNSGVASRAVDKCLVFLEKTETLCRETDGLRRSIEDTQSVIAVELLGWAELMADLERAVDHARKLRLNSL